MSHAPVDPTGQQVRLARGEVTAHIAQVGAALRGLTVRGTGIVAPYPEGHIPPMSSGTTLVPWPNRIRDGRWSMTDPHGREYDEQVPVSEPARGTALHGLLRHTPYVVAEDGESATLTAAVVPQDGYPFAVETVVRYALTDDGIRVTYALTNVGADAAPVAVGTHPFFQIEGVPGADLTLTLPAETWFDVDERLLPLEERAITTKKDLRGGARLGDVDLDRAYGSLARDEHGLAGTTLRAPDGRTVTIWQDEAFGYVQLFTTDAYPGQDRTVAVEPMTAPPDAFNSGEGVRWLEPGERWELSWGVAYSG
ncbi:aldose 1-epimerase family protein [Microbacterium excoecariae]|uniref:aldose 1-epimerase family protein n=1 Tax=Microbacterium excoecariae TaxID=2715210 RepID=UPI00140C26CA|nr:aldose 1-epimerase family protein [Microbacterium excoecariae]NHI16193.1 aldose 1-epimerase family protein [Microbacterium excoecariae]